MGAVLVLGGAEALPRKNLRAPHRDRLRALMDVLGYCGRGGQKRFAEAIGFNYTNFNMVVRGSGLSRAVQAAIFKRFFPRVSLEFLEYGLPGWGDVELEEKLREWERQNGRLIFRGPITRP